MNIVVDREVNQENWRAFKARYKLTNASMAIFIQEIRDDYLKSKMVRGAKNQMLTSHIAWVFSNFIKVKRLSGSRETRISTKLPWKH